MNNIIFISLLILAQIPLPSRLQAYAVSSYGSGLRDGTHLKYTPCNSSISTTKTLFILDGMTYKIYREQHVMDSVTALFCYRNIDSNDTKFISATMIKLPQKNQWQVYVTWEDSTKAFQAITIPK